MGQDIPAICSAKEFQNIINLYQTLKMKYIKVKFVFRKVMAET